MNPEFEDEKPLNPFDLWEGASFILKIRNVDGYRNYDRSIFGEVAEKNRQKLIEDKKRILDAIGKSSYGGVDVFEGTTPLKKGGTAASTGTPSSALEGVDPSDAGVDISSLLGGANVWKQLIK